jgi:hypothetical protein
MPTIYTTKKSKTHLHGREILEHLDTVSPTGASIVIWCDEDGLQMYSGETAETTVRWTERMLNLAKETLATEIRLSSK